MIGIRQISKRLLSVLILFAAAIPLWACGQSFEVSIIVAGTTATGSVVIDGEVKTFSGQVGSDGCVEWDIDGCAGRVCGCEPGSNFKVTCKDPLLAEWPDSWSLLSASWAAPDLGVSGDVLVWPAGDWYLPPEFGVIVPDPGYSAYVLKMDWPGDIGPTEFLFEFVFDVGDPVIPGCFKGLDIATIEYEATGCPNAIAPTDPALGLDFTVFGDGDPNVFCIDVTTPAEHETWGQLKQFFQK
jgi:hypothetical protein